MQTEAEDVQMVQTQYILDELDRMRLLVDRLVEKGLLTPKDEAHVQLSSDIRKLENLIKVLDKAGRTAEAEPLREKLKALQLELEIVDSTQ